MARGSTVQFGLVWARLCKASCKNSRADNGIRGLNVPTVASTHISRKDVNQDLVVYRLVYQERVTISSSGH